MKHTNAHSHREREREKQKSARFIFKCPLLCCCGLWAIRCSVALHQVCQFLTVSHTHTHGHEFMFGQRRRRQSSACTVRGIDRFAVQRGIAEHQRRLPCLPLRLSLSSDLRIKNQLAYRYFALQFAWTVLALFMAKWRTCFCGTTVTQRAFLSREFEIVALFFLFPIVHTYLDFVRCAQLKTRMEFQLFASDRADRYVRFILLQRIPQIRSTIHSRAVAFTESREQDTFRFSTVSCFGLYFNVSVAVWVCAKRAHFLCHCMCRNSLASCCAALVYVFTTKRTEVEHADEREGKHASANGTQRKQNIKFKGKLHLRPAAAAGCTASSAAQYAAYVAVSVAMRRFVTIFCSRFDVVFPSAVA